MTTTTIITVTLILLIMTIIIIDTMMMMMIRSDETSATDSDQSSPVQQLTPNNSPLLTRWSPSSLSCVGIIISYEGDHYDDDEGKDDDDNDGVDDYDDDDEGNIYFIFLGGQAVSTYSLNEPGKENQGNAKYGNQINPKRKNSITILNWIQKNVETPVWDLERQKGNSSCHKIPTVFKQSSIYI